MDSKILQPPEETRGMKILCREAFQKRVQVPCLRVNHKYANRVLPLIREKLLKMQNLKPVRDAKPEIKENEQSDDDKLNVFREILLHPSAVTCWESLPAEKLNQFEVTPSDFYFNKINLSYDNWRADEILDFVLSNEIEGLTSYSRIGHIIHLNLRENLQPYKHIIAQIFADKLSGVRTIVNKTSNIDNTYRNFELELLHGDADYKVETKENGIVFEFDFSRVYWNPRLSTEHERIVKMLQPNDVLYDIFAGVGPFSVPAAKKRCHVLSNDLNPESFYWLKHNMKRNKCFEHVQTFNKDGREFILTDLKNDLLQRWKVETENNTTPCYKKHITMNLPAMAPTFLNAFRGLFKTEELSSLKLENDLQFPIVHVYTFAKGEDTKTKALALVEENLAASLKKNFESISFVRNVAPNKDMYRISFRLTKNLLITSSMGEIQENEMPNLKRSSTDCIEMEPNTKLKCS